MQQIGAILRALHLDIERPLQGGRKRPDLLIVKDARYPQITNGGVGNPDIHGRIAAELGSNISQRLIAENQLS